MKANSVPSNRRSNVGYHVVVSNDHSLQICAGTVKLQNQGNTRVVVDNNIVLDPLETYDLADQEGGAIVHTMSIDFVALAAPPVADPPRIWQGNRLLVITVTRDHY